MRARVDFDLKRAFDITLCLAMIPLVLPFMAAIAMLVRVSSPGPILYRQQRCGRNGTQFMCYKFRTMVAHAELQLEENGQIGTAYRSAWKVRNDPRVTRMGARLRRSSLDELPQLLNVLRGDMSIVGPRPVPEPELRGAYGVAADIVTSIRPGLTGLWQVSGRSLLSYDERIALDLAYVAQRTLTLDCKILVRTLPTVIRGRGAM